ncbi:MAG: penicillin acylase family protein [Luteitalea sp.]|nr:penicillin acylase family protein [Luteitalea sp.]
MVLRLFVAIFAAGTALSARPAPERRTLDVDGLRAPVEIAVDPWGIAHIYARNEHDVFFAQGYNAARDRLFQLEIWRRRATGTIAEILGERELDRDIGARLLRYRGDLGSELNHYHPRGQQIIEAFTAGINAYIDEVRQDDSRLPMELRLLGIRPEPWTPEIVVSRHQGLFSNLTQELTVARAVRAIGADKVKELYYFHPGDPVLEPDPALDLTLLDANVLRFYRAHRSDIAFEPEDLATTTVGLARRRVGPTFVSGAPQTQDPASSVPADGIGSNNWVLSGRRTEHGAPIMANDPHRALQAPSLRYLVHLVAPGWNVIGGGEPALPGVSIGHNAHGAWGLTVFGIDMEDLYVYETRASNPNEYRYRGAWESMRVERETIRVKGAQPVDVTLKFTRHGPVLHEDETNHKAYALRAGWLEKGGAPYLASLRMNQATSWEEFRDACSYSRTPAENMVWADLRGTIGWQAVGIAPVRQHWSGLVPVPGDGRYEWDGYLPIKALPSMVDPDEGYITTANHNLVPDGYRHRNAVGWSWADPYRANRIHEVLASGKRFSMADMMALQHDELSIPARQLVWLLSRVEVSDPSLRRVIDDLSRWDFVLDRDSVEAAIYVSWERQLSENVRALMVPAEARALIKTISMTRVVQWLTAPDARFGADPVAGRDDLLRSSLREALADLTKRLGEDRSAWRYGQERFKHVLIKHPLGQAVPEARRAELDVGPNPRGGYGLTVNSTSGENNQASGASFRIIIDTANWDHSVGTNAPGQSGNPDSPHYRDLFELWVRGQYFPLLYSRERVLGAATKMETLRPTPGRVR